ncbi:hypothetical protein [Paralcaligenes ureilyticus]|uniref:Uncharacterized protein n=1 Tax=Paralcaligenes ureilyticus TaxID=627131 RepID=A0A4R3M7I6_9BURK|nr:hypothetical protein [Paralcaligenes ureilyticus]TCT09042.1 hypothetical protein EDC26_104202 [Paralcaligenes ureilyticus]
MQEAPLGAGLLDGLPNEEWRQAPARMSVITAMAVVVMVIGGLSQQRFMIGLGEE